MKISDILQPWQTEFVDFCTSNRLVVGMVHRQAGKSFAVSYVAVREAVVKGSSWIIVSNAERQAIELMRKCVKMAKYVEGMLRGTPLSFTFSNNTSEIRFSTGGRIVCVPNSPDTIRGFSGNLIWDEAAFSPNADELWQAVAPFLASKYGGEKQAIIISTPAGESGVFYDLWSNEDFAHFTKTIYDTGKTDDEISSLRRLCADDDIFAQEFECRFLDSNTALFSYDLLRASFYDADDINGLDGDVYLGIDIGRTHDRTAIAVLHRFQNANHIHHVETLHNKEFKEQFAYICRLVDSLKPKRICIDCTGIGMQIAEDLHRKYGGIVIKVQFNNSNKNEMFLEVKKQLGNGTLFLPKQEEIVEDMHKIRRIVGPSGNMRFAASSDEHGHADIATSIALAVRASTKQKTAFIPFAL